MTPLPRRQGRRLFLRRGFSMLAAVSAVLLLTSCISGKSDPPPDTVSPTRSQLIAAAGGFICLYREGANPLDLLYVKDTANAAGLQVIFKIAESGVIPEAIRKGWGDVAVGFTEAEAKNLGLRIISRPRFENELEFMEDAGTTVILLRSADEFLDALLNPEKKKKEPPALDEPLPGDPFLL